MKAINKLRERRALSPVIATVILVAVAITVAVAVSYWMSGIAGQYSSFEKVEIQSAVITHETGYWKIVIKLKNAGTKTSTLTNVFVNEVEATYMDLWTSAPTGGVIAADVDSLNTVQIVSGVTGTVNVGIGDGGPLSSGTTVNIKIHSAGGMDYIKLLQLT